MKVSCIIPTYRFGGMDVLFGGLKGQTLSRNEWELVLVDDLYDIRKQEVKEYAEQLDVPINHFKPPKSERPFACGHAINWGLRWAEGDYVMIGQDFIWLEPDCFERHLKIQKPKGKRVTVGYMPHMVAPPLKDLKGKLTVFDRLHEERPTTLELPDIRWSNLTPAPDVGGEDYARFKYHWYLTYYSVVPNALFPLETCIALNGYDERLDIGHGYNDDNFVFRMVTFLEHEVILDKKNVMYHITHPWSRKQQHPQQTETHYRLLANILLDYAGVKALNGYDLIQERCRVRHEKWVKESGGIEDPPLIETYQHPSQQRRLFMIKQMCQGIESVLEVGCSQGQVLYSVAAGVPKLAGIDVNGKVIEENRRRNPNVIWVEGDVTKGLPFPADSYDVVLLTEILEHIHWLQVSKLIREALRVAKKRVVITLPNATDTYYNRRWVEAEHHQWACTLDRLYSLTISFQTGLWYPRPNFDLSLNYIIDPDFIFFRLDKQPTPKEEPEVVKRAKKLKAMKEQEAEALRSKEG